MQERGKKESTQKYRTVRVGVAMINTEQFNSTVGVL